MKLFEISNEVIVQNYLNVNDSIVFSKTIYPSFLVSTFHFFHLFDQGVSKGKFHKIINEFSNSKNSKDLFGTMINSMKHKHAKIKD